ncbi:MAG: tetratricopeptide repeat protein [Nitrospirota bacterium]
MAQITESEEFFTRGLNELAVGHGLSALVYFEKAAQIKEVPVYVSYLALCIAKERGQIRKAISLCEEAIKREPENPIHYLNLGKIYLHAVDKETAINTFRAGLRYETNQQIIEELNKLQTRRPPVIPFLERNNPINKYLGIILSRLGLR